MKVGDMVRICPGGSPVFFPYKLVLHTKWFGRGSGRGQCRKVGSLLRGQCVVVLEHLDGKGKSDSGAKILSPDGRVGWCNASYLEVVS